MKFISKETQTDVRQRAAGSQTWLRYPRHGTVQYEARTFTQAQVDSNLQSADFLQFLRKTSLRVEKILAENEVLNPFTDSRGCIRSSGTMGKVFSRWLKLVPQPDFQFVHHVHLCDSKLVTDIHWHPSISGVFVASYAEKVDFESRASKKKSSSETKRHFALVWRTAYLFAPMVTLEAPEDVSCVQFSLYDPHLIAGGCLNGKILVWDISRYEGVLRDSPDSFAGSSRNSSTCSSRANSAMSSTFTRKIQHYSTVVIPPSYMSMEISYSAIRMIQWVPPYIEFTNKGHSPANPTKRVAQLYVCNGEGYLSVWDVKLLDRKDLHIEHLNQKNFPTNPTRLKCVYKMYSNVKDKRRDVALTSFFMTGSHESKSPFFESRLSEAMETSFPSLCIAGSNEGEILIGDWKNSHEIDRGAAYRAAMCLPFHDGAVTGIFQNFFHSDLFFSIGGKTWALWRTSFQEGPVVQLPRRYSSITSACWSPCHPAVCILGLGDGQVEIWDLSVSLTDPCKTMQLSKSAITVLAFSSSNSNNSSSSNTKTLMAVGDADGNGVIQLLSFLSHQDDINIQKKKLEDISSAARRRVPAFFQSFQKDDDKEKIDEDKGPSFAPVPPKRYSKFIEIERRVLKQINEQTA